MVTVNVNNLSLVHKGSNGISMATIPDVCKTPSPGGPVPIPYPNVSMSSNLASGSTTVKADGGNMIGVKGCNFSTSTGDEAGTAGGVKSGKFKGKSEFILSSMDVKIDGKNACRLTDKKTQNDGNTVDLCGVAQAPLVVGGVDLHKLACECIKEKTWKQVRRIKLPKVPKKDRAFVRCCILGSKRHKCVADKLKEPGNQPNDGSMIHSPAGANYQSGALPKGQKYCRPDLVITKAGVKPPPAAGDMTAIIDLKFQCDKSGKLQPAKQWDPAKQMSTKQKKCYEKIKLKGGAEKPGGVPVDHVAPTSENCK